jgi:hypothetical protein
MSVTPSIASLQDFSPTPVFGFTQSDRPLGADESVRIGQSLDVFCRQWTARQSAVKSRCGSGGRAIHYIDGG